MKKRLTLQDKALIAMKQAVKKVLEQHKKDSTPIAIWENGKVKRVMVK